MSDTRNLRGAIPAAGFMGACLLAPVAATAAEPNERVLTPIAVSADVLDNYSPYRTGGDVQIVTRDEIDSRHYLNVTDAIRRIPGVQVSGPGYKAYEYGTTFGEEISINGDSSVIILIDGRRIDNDAASYGQSNASKSKVPLDVLTNINNIERIEVIKGTGAAAYGADATGGVINIITRKGGDDHQTRVEVSAGSWNKRNYTLTQGGSFGADNKFRYFASFNHQKSGDTKYKDSVTENTIEYNNTGYKDSGASLRLSYEFNPNHELNVQYSYTGGISYYPITAPDMATINLLYAGQLPLTALNGVAANARPGYRNWFYWDAALGSYSSPHSNDAEIKYTFNKANGVESYVRAFRNDRKYRTRLFGGVFGTQWQNVTQAIIDNARRSAGRFDDEIVDGYEVQLARTLGRHSVLSGATYRQSEAERFTFSTGLSSFVERDSLLAYVQDTVQVTDRWKVTPGLRYSDYSDIKRTSTSNVVSERGGTSKTTWAIYSSYESDIFGNLYASYSQIFRPKTNNDYNNEAPAIEPLFDEEGDSYTVGLRRTFGTTAFNIDYSVTDMSNATARYSIFDPTVVNAGSPTGFGNFVTRQVNATQEKKALNIGIDHRFNERWTLRGNYAYVKDLFDAKNWRTNPDDVNVNALINRFRPSNVYRADGTYTRGPWTVTGWAEAYTGMSTRYFTDERFLVLGTSINYDLPGLLGGNGRAFLTVDNLTNQSWENRGHPVYGPGTYPQPGRNFMVGFQQNF